MFGRDTGFAGEWRDALFVADWASGTILAVFLEPDGSSIKGKSEVFARLGRCR